MYICIYILNNFILCRWASVLEWRKICEFPSSHRCTASTPNKKPPSGRLRQLLLPFGKVSNTKKQHQRQAVTVAGSTQHSLRSLRKVLGEASSTVLVLQYCLLHR